MKQSLKDQIVEVLTIIYIFCSVLFFVGFYVYNTQAASPSYCVPTDDVRMNSFVQQYNSYAELLIKKSGRTVPVDLLRIEWEKVDKKYKKICE